MGEICCKGYDLLKYRLAEIVKDTTNEFWFQKDEDYIYTFDESSLPNGGIYGLKEKRGGDTDPTSKLTASKLIPLKCPGDFDRNVTSVAVVKYRLGGRRKVRKSTEYFVELCVVLIKEKKKKKVAPVTSIVCNDGAADGTITTSGTSGGGSSSRKRKASSIPFTFQATQMSITLFAPIETTQKKSGITTGVPSGKTNKGLTYDLSPFIIGGDKDDISTDSGPLEDNEVGDEEFIVSFTLSKFRKDLMVLAMENFKEEYGLAKKTLGRKCKLFIQKQWNTSTWTEIPTTEMFVQTVHEQIATKSRVTNNTVAIRISFGKSKAGLEFSDEEDFSAYTCQDFGDSINFSQNEVPTSPFVRMVGAVKRDDSWNKPARISELVAVLYKRKDCKLHHGFLKEHGNAIYRIISADLSINKDTSIYLCALNDPLHILSNDIIDSDLLPCFIRSHSNSVVGAPMPETGKFPPTNETMMDIPPTLREWKSTQIRLSSFHHSITPPHHALYPSLPSVPPVNISGVDSGDITALTFKAAWDDELEVSVIIEDPLSLDSVMEMVMLEGDVFVDLGALIEEISTYKFLVLKKNGGNLSFKWNKFKTITVRTLIRINNVDSDLAITLKR